jgi:Zn-dependent M28 family amino/carboxypeptidase
MQTVLFLQKRLSDTRRARLLHMLAAIGLMVAAAPAGWASDAAAMRETVENLQARALQDDLAWELLASLTTDVGPRLAGTPGDALAVAWAQDRMRTLRFDRVWLEPVAFPLWQRRSESATVVSPRRQELAATALGGSPGTGGPVRADVVHFSDLEELEAADPARLAGKIAFVSARMERLRTGEGYGKVVGQRSKGPFVAAAKGAAALIIRSVGTDDNRLAHTGNMSTSHDGEPAPAAAISNPDADLLVAMLNAGEPVRLELNLDCGFNGSAVSYNVIGEFEGTEQGAGIVAIGGHLDSWDLGTGAHDDGTGVAITLAAARLVAGLSPRPRRGIRVVLFANEEQGVYGGMAYAAAHAADLAMHAVGAESDLGGGRIFQFRSRVSSAAAPAIDELAALLKPLGIPYEPRWPAFGGADFGQMVKLGMPAIDLDHDATRYFDYHHTANDTLDKVDPEALRFNVAAWATFLYFAAETATEFGPLDPDEQVRPLPLKSR